MVLSRARRDLEKVSLKLNRIRTRVRAEALRSDLRNLMEREMARDAQHSVRGPFQGLLLYVHLVPLGALYRACENVTVLLQRWEYLRHTR